MLTALILALPLLAASLPVTPPASSASGAENRLAALEHRSGGRLGVSVLDSATGRRLDYRAGERFPMCSTFKVALAGFALAEVDAGRARADERLSFGEKDLLEYAPICRARVAEGGLPLTDACAAAVIVSDNTAANLLLTRLGGPSALTAFLRRIGDPETRLDRTEPGLNEALPGDPRDTTTPAAMRATLQELLTRATLSDASRKQLAAWMAASTTGARRLRAGLPPGWDVKDKTGTGARGTSNDVAMVTPPGRAPIFVAAYLTGSSLDGPGREAVLAEVARIVAGTFAR